MGTKWDQVGCEREALQAPIFTAIPILVQFDRRSITLATFGK